MFNFLGDGIDGVYKALWFLIGLQLVMSGGIGFIFRIISKPLNINFENEKLRAMDRKLSDLQLLKLYYGINVSSIEDAELAALAIARKKIKPQRIWLMLFCPSIGNYKHGKFELCLMSALIIFCIYNAFSQAIDAKDYREDYVLLSDESGRVLMSEIYVKDLNTGKNYNRSECKNLPEKSSSILKLSCNYLTTDDQYLRKELALAINKNNRDLIIINSSAIFFLCLAIFFAIAYNTYRDVNNSFYEFRRAEFISRAEKKYGGIFKNHER